MKNHLKTVTLLLFVAFSTGAILFGRTARSANVAGLMLWPDTVSTSMQAARPVEQGKTAEQVYKNIQVLKGIPASQLQGAMSFMADSLGVGCSYCHSKTFDADDKQTRLLARLLRQRRG